MRTVRIGAVTMALALLLVGCGGEKGGGTDASTPDGVPPEQTSETAATDQPGAADDDVTPSTAGDACALLDVDYLNSLMEGETTMLGTPYDFQEPLNSSPSDYCAWKEGSSGLELRLTLEPTATSAIDDHTGRGYNLDVDPVPVPQDGPGTSAVLLTDPAFAESGEENFAYGYFYVADEVTVFVKSVGLDLGAERLREMADETARRLGV